MITINEIDSRIFPRTAKFFKEHPELTFDQGFEWVEKEVRRLETDKKI
jgi:hypothetical protein